LGEEPELEARRLAPATVNLRLAAVRRLAYEAADIGLLSPELAAGIRRVKGAKRIGVRLGNWLTAEQSRSLLRVPDDQSLISRRDRAILAPLLGCGLRRGEMSAPMRPLAYSGRPGRSGTSSGARGPARPKKLPHRKKTLVRRGRRQQLSC